MTVKSTFISYNLQKVFIAYRINNRLLWITGLQFHWGGLGHGTQWGETALLKARPQSWEGRGRRWVFSWERDDNPLASNGPAQLWSQGQGQSFYSAACSLGQLKFVDNYSVHLTLYGDCMFWSILKNGKIDILTLIVKWWERRSVDIEPSQDGNTG